MKELEVMEREVRACIVEDLRRAQYVSLTTDFWTSLANDSYLGVTAHMVTPNWKLSSYVLQTQEVEESHTAERVAQLLEATAREWEITEKVAAITTDNAPNMVKAVLEVLQWEHIGCLTLWAHPTEVSYCNLSRSMCPYSK